MGGTRAGGIKTRQANLARDPDYYRNLGRLGGSSPKTKPHGFLCATPEERRQWGRKGGSISRRGPSVV